jgi:segregation and condensation protein B
MASAGAPAGSGSLSMRKYLRSRGPVPRAYRPDLPHDRRPPAVFRFAGIAGRDDVPQGELARDARLATVEAALLAADEPLTAKRLAMAAGLDGAPEVRRLLAKLRELYDVDGTAFQVEEVAGGYQLLTRAEYHPWLARLRRSAPEMRLTPAARETLAIIAYRQPITRADVEAVRGVQCGDVLGQLMDKGLVRIAGREESLGRPILYGTTKKFLQLYGLKSLRELPQAEGLTAPGAKKPAAEKAEEEPTE